MIVEPPLSLSPDVLDTLIAMRRHLHMHPEVSNDEHETQRYLLERIRGAGIDGARSVVGTGVIVDIAGTQPTSNRCIAVRADIDALPIQEDTGSDFASRNPGVMHACGHDAHTAMAFAAMLTLHRSRDRFGGTVRFIFQPAEEAEPLGGRRIVEEGHLDGVDAAIGIHIDPYLESGKVAVGAGPYTLASDIFDITLKGTLAHAAKPHEGVDALATGCALVGELQKLVSRETGPFDPLVLSITKFHAGNSYNILPEDVVISGTLRSGRDKTRNRALGRIEAIVKAMTAMHGIAAKVDVVRGEPPVVNDPEMVSVISGAVVDCRGEAALINAPGWEAADDFGFYSQAVPSVYFRLGVRDPGRADAYPLHHPRLNVDESALPLGAAVIVASAQRALKPVSGR